MNMTYMFFLNSIYEVNVMSLINQLRRGIYVRQETFM